MSLIKTKIHDANEEKMVLGELDKITVIRWCDESSGPSEFVPSSNGVGFPYFIYLRDTLLGYDTIDVCLGRVTSNGKFLDLAGIYV